MFFADIGLHVPVIHLPKPNIDLNKWSVIACDQYTSQPEYWQKVESLVARAPSTFHLIYPEVYLEAPNKAERISNICHNMQKYLEESLLQPEKSGFILLDRSTPNVGSRKGLIVALDLEQYDFHKGAQTLIRATEGTVMDRLPPRMKIREQAQLEVPHIMVLIDDPDKTVIEPLFDLVNTPIYDFDLMDNAGHITGFKIDKPEIIEQIANNLRKLAKQEVFERKYQVQNQGILLYAMGDGNHSLATAKALWEQTKQKATDKQAILNHPARFALVELVNLHDAGIIFEPIHRTLFGVDTAKLLTAFREHSTQQGIEFKCEEHARETVVKSLPELKKHADQDVHTIPFVTAERAGYIRLIKPKFNLAVGSLQAFLDHYLSLNKGAAIDYIHGDDTVFELGSQPHNIGFCLPAMSKHQLFKTVIIDGVLPRKTFSMGDAIEKRFYLETRRIV